MRINLVLGGEVDEIIIFDVEIRRAEINLFTRVDPLRCNSGAQFFAPEIGPGNVNFVTWPARQTRALRLRNIGGGSFFRLEITIAGGAREIGTRHSTQFSLYVLTV